MDSDSGSQDSDEGRRFRFEATRKDAAKSTSLEARRESPKRSEDARWRSEGRSVRQRRERSRSREDRRKKRETPETGSRESPGRHRDAGANFRGSSLKYSRRDPRSWERRRSSIDRKTGVDKREKYRETRRRYSGLDRGRETSSQTRRTRDDETSERRRDNPTSLRNSGDSSNWEFEVVSDTEDDSPANSPGRSDERRIPSPGSRENGRCARNDEDAGRRVGKAGREAVTNSHRGESPMSEERSDDSTWGPALPPASSVSGEETKPAKVARILGPRLPENFQIPRENSYEEEEEEEETFGPALPPHFNPASVFPRQDETIPEAISESEEEEEEDFTGPLPADHPAMESDDVQRQLERRARRLKAQLAACDDGEEKKREEWMTELPPAKSANLGLGARKFRTRPAPDMSDRSSWTDTPADRARKRIERLENKNACGGTAERETRETSLEMERSKKREESLLEMHRKKLHKKKKREEREARKIGKKAERRPFDRDVDLQANRFDEARKKSMFLKARELDDRFSRGKI